MIELCDILNLLFKKIIAWKPDQNFDKQRYLHAHFFLFIQPQNLILSK